VTHRDVVQPSPPPFGGTASGYLATPRCGAQYCVEILLFPRLRQATVSSRSDVEPASGHRLDEPLRVPTFVEPTPCLDTATAKPRRVDATTATS
jgi:hypothetical protein